MSFFPARFFRLWQSEFREFARAHCSHLFCFVGTVLFVQLPGLILRAPLASLLIYSFWMSGRVMKARKEFNVLYPNLYATPGYHKEADAFNRVQRGHQNSLELITSFTVTSLLGGLKYPIACSVYGVFFSLGNCLYLAGYSDTSLDVKTARYKKGGILRIIGMMASVGSTISLAGSMNGWW